MLGLLPWGGVCSLDKGRAGTALAFYHWPDQWLAINSISPCFPERDIFWDIQVFLSGNHPTLSNPFFVEPEAGMLLKWGYQGPSACSVPSLVPPASELLLLCVPYVLDVLCLEAVRTETTTCSLQVTVLVNCTAETKSVCTTHILTIFQPPK